MKCTFKDFICEARMGEHTDREYVPNTVGLGRLFDQELIDDAETDETIIFKNVEAPQYDKIFEIKSGTIISSSKEAVEEEKYEVTWWESSKIKASFFIQNTTTTNIFLQRGKKGKKPSDDVEPKLPDIYEIAICIEFNKQKGMSEDTAIKQANIPERKIKKGSTYHRFKDKLVPTAKKIVTDPSFPDAGGRLVHTGTGIKGVQASEKWPSKNSTPKTDILGNQQNRFSVKQSGKAQLMSGEKPDALGVLKGGLELFEHNDPTTFKPEYRIAVDQMMKTVNDKFTKLHTDLSTGATTNEVISDFVEYRKKELIDQLKDMKTPSGKPLSDTKKDELLTTHIKNELAKHKLSMGTAFSPDKFVSDLPVLKKSEFDYWFKKIYLKSKPEKVSKQIIDIIDGSINNKIINDAFNKFFECKGLKKWCIYEAATGQYKFTGTPDLNVTSEGVANKFLIFTTDGKVTTPNITPGWAERHTDAVNVSANFKSSGKFASTTLRLSVLKTVSATMTVASAIRTLVDSEFQKFNEDLIVEFNLKDILHIGTYLKEKLADLYENVLKKAFNVVYDLIMKGLNYLLEYLGFEIEGKATVDEIEFAV